MSKSKGKEFKQTLPNEYIDKNYYNRYLPEMEKLIAKGERVTVLSREMYAVELQELKAGHLGKTDEQVALQRKNPNRELVNMSRYYKPRQTTYFINVGREIRGYSEEAANRLENAISSDPLLAKYGKDIKNPVKLRKILNQDSAAREAYIKALAGVKKPGTYVEKQIVRRGGKVDIYEGEEQGLDAWIVPGSPQCYIAERGA